MRVLAPSIVSAPERSSATRDRWRPPAGGPRGAAANGVLAAGLGIDRAVLERLRHDGVRWPPDRTGALAPGHRAAAESAAIGTVARARRRVLRTAVQSLGSEIAAGQVEVATCPVDLQTRSG